MFKNYHVIIMLNDENVDHVTKIAANNGLYCLYKIGVYGKEKQHELYVIGSNRNYRKFMKAMEAGKKK